MTNTAMKLAGVAIGLMAAACSDGAVTNVLDEPPPGATELPAAQVDTLVCASYSGVTERRRDVIVSDAEWRAFWELVHARVTPMPPALELDFAESVVIVAAMGGRVTGGYTIDIDGVHRTAEGVVIEVTETSPGAGCLLTQAMTWPVVAVAVPRVGGEVAFIERESVRDCS